MVDASGPNAKEIAYWNGANGRKWVRFQESMDRMLHPLSREALDTAGIAEGLGVNVNTIYARIRAARKQLAEAHRQLSEEGAG